MFFNQYSYLITAIVITSLIALFLFRDGFKRRDVIAVGVIAGAFAIAWFFTRPVSSNLSAEQIEVLLNSGRPTLIEFQSEY
jgi:xanthine/uracil permease